MSAPVTYNNMSLERQLSRVEEATKRIESNLNNTNNRLNQATNEITALNKEIAALKTSFDQFMNDSKKATTLQKAATELIRVRQELEQNYGGYKIVRETMLGVLQATDLALVKKTTISQVTEELMLSTPDYWLAPCLVAVSAWIGNDRDLANRAIKEALKRDEEKTALTMALICRRNNRKDTCFEWLSIYFAKQSAENFTESNFTYLNAYLNGVFGNDDKHMCEDYVAKWMREIQQNGDDFENRQTELWKNYCNNFTVDLEGQFPQLKSSVPEYQNIADYVSRINTVDKISTDFAFMQNVSIEGEKLKKDIDKTLVTLISRCDEKEEPLRKEEKYLQAIRYFNGDTEAAKRSVLEADKKRTEATIDLVGQMTNIIINRKDADPSERKTSINFLRGYIHSGFRRYLSEKKPVFPQQITLKVDSWTGTTVNCTNANDLHRSYEMHMNNERQQAVNAVAAKAPPMSKPLDQALKIILWIFALPYMLYYTWNEKQKEKARQEVVQHINAINVDYTAKIAAGHRRIDQILNEWDNVKTVVANFEKNDIPNIVA